MTSPTKSNAAPAKILIVGNHRAGAAARKVVLEEQGYVVRTASNVQEALEMFQNDPHDLVITAYRLGPNSPNGSDLIAGLRAIQADLPIVVISGVAEVLGLNERDTGADAVIQKSATEVPHMLRVVGRLLRRKTPKKPPAAEGGRAPRRRASGQP